MNPLDPGPEYAMQRGTVGRPMEVLLVEDSVPAARLAIGGLKTGRFEHRLTWLRDGVEASRFLHCDGIYARAPQPDLILLDLGLPLKDGREVLAEIKVNERLQSIPVVIMTASTDQQDMLITEDLRVEAYLVKPFDIKKFLDVVRDLKRFWKADMILPTRLEERLSIDDAPQFGWT